jgi:3-oxoacyl-ACP reductase-like protein
MKRHFEDKVVLVTGAGKHAIDSSNAICGLLLDIVWLIGI